MVLIMLFANVVESSMQFTMSVVLSYARRYSTIIQCVCVCVYINVWLSHFPGSVYT